MEQAQGVEYPPNTAVQTDLTVADITSLEDDYLMKTCELAETHTAKGYLSQEDLQKSEKFANSIQVLAASLYLCHYSDWFLLLFRMVE